MSDVSEITIVKQEKNAIFYSDGTILIKNVRLSFPHLDKAWAGPRGRENEGGPKFSGKFLAPKTPDYKASIFLVRDRINELMREAKWKDLPAARKFLRDGDNEGREEMQGHYLISAAESYAPALRDSKRRPVDRSDALDVFYPGCWVNVLIRPWVQADYGKRINANLLAVQRVPTPPGMPDESFSTGRISDNLVDSRFEVIEDDDSGFDGSPSGYDDDDL